MIDMIGLGRMGANMARRLLAEGHHGISTISHRGAEFEL